MKFDPYIEALAVELHKAGFTVIESGPLAYHVIDMRTHVPGTVLELTPALTPDQLLVRCREILSGKVTEALAFDAIRAAFLRASDNKVEAFFQPLVITEGAEHDQQQQRQTLHSV